MKVVAFNGSPNAKGNTYHSIEIVCEQLRKQDISTEIIHVGSRNVNGCMSCAKCFKNKDGRCGRHEDINDWIEAAVNADGLIFGSPVHFSGVAGNMKSFLDRLFYVSFANGNLLRHKVGASVAAVRRSGGINTCDEINHYIQYSEMFMPSSNYWNVIHGAAPGEVLQDSEGVQILTILGENMAWLMKLIENGKGSIAAPAKHKKVSMNFIRK